MYTDGGATSERSKRRRSIFCACNAIDEDDANFSLTVMEHRTGLPLVIHFCSHLHSHCIVNKHFFSKRQATDVAWYFFWRPAAFVYSYSSQRHYCQEVWLLRSTIWNLYWGNTRNWIGMQTTKLYLCFAFLCWQGALWTRAHFIKVKPVRSLRVQQILLLTFGMRTMEESIVEWNYELELSLIPFFHK